MNLCSLSFWLNSLSYESKKIAQKKKIYGSVIRRILQPLFSFWQLCDIFFQWEVFSIPELQNFMKILDKEEEEHILQVSSLLLYQPSLSYIYTRYLWNIRMNVTFISPQATEEFLNRLTGTNFWAPNVSWLMPVPLLCICGLILM